MCLIFSFSTYSSEKFRIFSFKPVRALNCNIMTVCRTCLKTPADKDISQLEKNVNKNNKNYTVDIMMFCLNIAVTPNAKITTNLCKKCYRKIISFYKFKTLSIENDDYLKSLKAATLVDQEILVHVYENEMKHENSLDPDESGPNVVEDGFIVKEEVDVKSEDSEDIDSGKEEQSLKEENKEEFKEEIRGNAPEPETKNVSEQVKPSKVKQALKICELCGKSVKHLKQHSLRHRPPSQRPLLQCEGCSKTFVCRRSLQQHNKIKHSNYKSECDICHKSMAWPSGLAVHKMRVHFPHTQPFGCTVCERRFISQAELALHMTMHTNVRAYECDICHRKFRIKDRMTRHIRQVHQKERSHQCHFCPKRYFEKYFLDEHIRTHTKELREFECDECGKVFAKKELLKHHQVLHSDAKAVYCELCDRSFASIYSLKQHNVMHSNIKPFHCQLCNKSFARQGNLKLHMVTHTKEKNHPCQFCGMSFGRSDQRNRHEKNVHQKKPS